ncbi:MAG TPA: ATP-binding protein [bacterium]|nr:ATP-binding protein [bacterium]HQP98940.1 ATP-binding protein [bacterium]
MKRSFLSRLLDHTDKIDKQQVVDYLVEVAEERDLLRFIFDSMMEGMVVIGSDMTVSYLNRAAADLFVVEDIDEALGKPAQRIIRNRRILQLCEEGLRTTEGNLHRELFLRMEDREIYLQTNVVPLHLPHSEFAILLLFVDRTEERRVEERLRHAEKLASLSTLTAGMSHEIRNPLNSLSIHLQLLRRKLRRCEEQDGETVEILGVLQNEIKRLNNVLTSFLSAARRDAASFIRLSPRSLITDTLALMRPDLENEGIEVIVHEEGEIPEIRGDPIQLKQAFINILKNAVDAIKEASQTLLEEGREPGERRVTITLVREEGQVNFIFTDTGAGILDSDMEKVFEPYFTTRESGTGLGLMIVNRIVHEHHGDVNIRSRIGQGTQAIVSLPMAPEPTKLLEHAAHSAATETQS